MFAAVLVGYGSGESGEIYCVTLHIREGNALSVELEACYAELLNGYLTEYSTEQFKFGIKEILLNNYGIPEEECEILIDTKIDSGQLRVDKMQILLSGRSIFKNPYDIEHYITELVGCECCVLIKSG